MRLLFLLTIILLLSPIFVSSDSHLPPAILEGQKYQQESAKEFLKSLSFFIAFFAGILSILSPCSYVAIPAFFSYSFKEKSQITKMTLVFFLGFSTIFIGLGLVAAKLGLTIAQYQYDNPNLALWAGLFLLFFGVLTLFGKGFGMMGLRKKLGNDAVGIYLYGVFFALGWNVCAGPILAGILVIASVLGNYLNSGLLMLAYSLGVFVPLFVLSLLWDKFDFAKSRFLQGKNFRLFNKDIHSTNLIAGLLIIATGILMIVYRGTYIINAFDIFRTTEYFYSIQRNLTIKPLVYNIVGFLILLVLIVLLVQHVMKKRKVSNY